MKIKVSAQMPEDERDYQNLKAYIKARHPGAKIKESAALPPQKVLYAATRKYRRKGKT